MPRYVVLRHETPPGAERTEHWDWMFEAAESLATWAVERLPTDGSDVAAERLPDHRKAYLDYEGPISGGRGDVRRWDEGEFSGELPGAEGLSQTPAGGAVVQLVGRRLRGELTIHSSEGAASAESSGGWRFSWRSCNSDAESPSSPEEA